MAVSTGNTRANLMSVARFEHFFRAAGGLDVDKADLDRFSDFIARKIHDLLTRGEEVARANLRDVVQPWDLPIANGLKRCITDFRRLDADINVEPLMRRIAALPPLDLVASAETEAMLPPLAGGLGVALARSFHVLEPELKNPQTRHWERSWRLFDLLL